MEYSIPVIVTADWWGAPRHENAPAPGPCEPPTRPEPLPHARPPRRRLTDCRRGPMTVGTMLLPLQLLLLLAQQAPAVTVKRPNKPFDVAWSGLWPCCGGQTAFNLTQFPVLQTKRLAVLDGKFGLYTESVPPLGIPQSVDLAKHAAKVARDAATDGGLGNNLTIIPAGKDMYCCIDWEQYTPVLLDHATPARPTGGPGSGGCPGVYSAPDGNSRYSMPGGSCATCEVALNASVARVLAVQPGLNVSTAAALAVAEFNAAARVLWTTTLQVAQKTRPDCHWGFYGKPETEDIVPPFVDPFDRAVGDAFQVRACMCSAVQSIVRRFVYLLWEQLGSMLPDVEYCTDMFHWATVDVQRSDGHLSVHLYALQKQRLATASGPRIQQPLRPGNHSRGGASKRQPRPYSQAAQGAAMGLVPLHLGSSDIARGCRHADGTGGAGRGRSGRGFVLRGRAELGPKHEPEDAACDGTGLH